MKRYAYIDIEATHTNWHDAKIIEIAFIIKDDEGKDLDFFQSLIRPQAQLTSEITHLTGITQAMVDNAPELHDVAQRIYEKLEGCIIVAHKIEFDFEILNKELSLLGLNLKNKKICTLLLSQKLIPELKSYSLKALCSLIQYRLKNHHRALEDANALYHLHTYLKMISGEVKVSHRYLPEHQKQIEKTPKRAGVIIIKGTTKEIIKTDNLKNKLSELLMICPINKKRIAGRPSIKIIQSGSLVKAGLLKSHYEKKMFPFCVYKIKNKNKKIILKIGNTNIKKKAIFYTQTKKEAHEFVKNLTIKCNNQKYAYFEGNHNYSDIVKENIELTNQLKKIIHIDKNFLIRSSDKLDGKYQYTLVRGNKSYTTFETETKITHSGQINFHQLKFKNLGPREYMSVNHSLGWIKNQKFKTDSLFEIKNFNS